MRNKDSFFFGLGNLGYGVVSQTYTNFIMFFGTGVLNISGSIMGLLIAISVLWDGFNDPFIGFLSDKFKNRHKFIMFGFVGMSIVNILLWCVPAFLGGVFKVVYLLLFMLLIETFNTCFHVPYSALSAEMPNNDEGLLNYQKYKSVFFIISMIFPTVFMSLFFNSEVSLLKQSSYIIVGVISSVICLICSCVCYKVSKIKLKKHYTKEKRTTFKELFLDFKLSIKKFFIALKIKDYLIIVICYAISLIICAFVTCLGFHMFTYAFKYSSLLVNLLLITLIVFAVLGQFVWTKAAQKIGQKKCLILGEIISATICILLLLNYFNVGNFAGNICLIISYILVASIGFSSSVLYSIPLSMFNKLILKNNKINNTLDTASNIGMLMLSYQVANAVFNILLGVFLDFIGFNSEMNLQTIFASNMIVYMLLLGLCIAFLISAILHSKLSNELN